MARRLVTSFLLWCAIGITLGLGALVTGPGLAGVMPYTVLSGSMQPALDVGDVVLDERVRPDAVRPGDMVTFPDPSRGGDLVTHRVRSLRRAGADVAFVTQGDANNVSERWTVAADGTIGRVAMRVPRVGYVVNWAGSRDGRIALIALPAFLLVLIELRRLLRPASVREAPA